MSTKEMRDKVAALLSQYSRLRTGAERLRGAAGLIAHEAMDMDDLADQVQKDLKKHQADCKHPDQEGRSRCNFCNKLLIQSIRLDRGR